MRPISEEFGLVGNLVLITGFVLLVWRALAIALQATTLFGRLMAAAVAMIFFTYAFVNMGMVSGILPVVGRAAALPELRWHGHGHAGAGAGHFDVHCPRPASGAAHGAAQRLTQGRGAKHVLSTIAPHDCTRTHY